MPELVQLPREIDRVPEERAIEILAPNRPDQPFDEGMGDRSVGNRLDLLNLEHAQVGKPPVESKQRVVIGADAFRKGLAGNRAVEHPAHGYAIDVGPLDTETNDAAGEEIQYHQNPVTMQEDRFASEQVDAPEAILELPHECQPGGSIGSGLAWPVVLGEHPAHDILVDLDAEGVGDLLGDTDTAELGIAAT